MIYGEILILKIEVKGVMGYKHDFFVGYSSD